MISNNSIKREVGKCKVDKLRNIYIYKKQTNEKQPLWYINPERISTQNTQIYTYNSRYCPRQISGKGKFQK